MYRNYIRETYGYILYYITFDYVDFLLMGISKFISNNTKLINTFMYIKVFIFYAYLIICI